MHRMTQCRGWTKFLLATMVLLFFLCAITAAASHIHLPGKDPGETHCTLCALGTTLVTVVVCFALRLLWRRTLVDVTYESEFFRPVSLSIYSIRPPPQASCSI
jgi:hypothetical protein